MTYAEALAKWQEMEKTKYGNGVIKRLIDGSLGEYSTTGESQRNVMIAQAMIAYNNMIDASVERAKRSWKDA